MTKEMKEMTKEMEVKDKENERKCKPPLPDQFMKKIVTHVRRQDGGKARRRRALIK